MYDNIIILLQLWFGLSREDKLASLVIFSIELPHQFISKQCWLKGYHYQLLKLAK